MSTKEIFGFLTIPPRENSSGPVQTEVQAGNVFFKGVTRRRTIQFWDTNLSGSTPGIRLQPWKNASKLVDDDETVGHSFLFNGTYTDYPQTPPAPTIGTLDYRKFRATGLTTTIASSAISRVIGSVGAVDLMQSEVYQTNNTVISINDVPLEYTQIGIVYQHPVVAGGADLTIATLGQSFVSHSDGHYTDFPMMEAHAHNVLRIRTGPDAGMYFVRYVDYVNNRLYLMNLDGTLFSAQAGSQTSVQWDTGPGRRAYFNEVSILQASTGTVVTGGTFRPGRARNSFIMRVVFDKTGSDASAVGTEQQGSYYVALKPYTHGDGLTNNVTLGPDMGRLFDTALQNSSQLAPYSFAFWDGGCHGIVVDEARDRAWFTYSNNSNQSGIGFWKWKTVESFREIANYLGTGAHKTFVTPSINLGAGDQPGDIKISPSGVVYISVYHGTAGNAGLVIINPDLTTSQVLVAPLAGTGDTIGGTAPSMTLTDAAALFTAQHVGRSITIASATSGANNGTFLITGYTSPSVITYQNHAGVAEAFTGTWSILGFPSSTVFGSALDSTRARTASSTSTDGSNNVTCATGGFTNSDIGRAIKLTGLGGDSGTYKIDTVGGATTVGVTTLAGAAVTFTTQSGGSFEIGDRVYFFFFTGAQGAGKINYMESLAPGTFLTRTVAMTNGSNINIRGKVGESAKVSIDPANGNVYWLSSDVQQQVNKYNVTTNAHSLLNVADVQSPAGGTGTVGTITAFTAILVNPKFDEIWVGTDQGQVRVVKSTFAAGTVKRYYGADNGTYANPAGFFRPSGGTTTTLANYVRQLWLHPDGRVSAFLSDVSASSATQPYAYYSREADCWTWKEGISLYMVGLTPYMPALVFDSIGNFLHLTPSLGTSGGSGPWVSFGSVEVQYQWDNGNSRWIPLEVQQGFLPNKSVSDTTNSPGCLTKPIHAGLEDVLYGVKLGFTKLGGATPANNEFLGRAGQKNVAQTDGATNGTTTFAGSGFISGDVGKLLRIETSTVPADQGVYKIITFTSSIAVILAKMNGGTFAPGSATGITYSIWDMGSPGSNAGPETATVLLADGFGKDNTQDISGITYDTYHFKTLLEENVEGTKFAVTNPIGVPGGQGMKVYYESYPRSGAASINGHDHATTQLRALPAEWVGGGFDGSKLVDSFLDGLMDGTSNRGLMWSSPGNTSVWYGTVTADGYGFLTYLNSVLGCCPMVDIGADAEVGYVIVRGRTINPQNLISTNTNHGLKATLYKASNANGTPVGSLVQNGTGDSITFATPNVSLTDAAALFTAAHVGQFITITGATTAANNGCFPITSVTPGTVLVYTNAAAVVESFAAVTWVITKYGTRTTGTANLTASGTNTITVTTGDFLGPIALASLSNGSVVSGGNTLTNAAATFLQSHVGMVLKITSVGDVGAYRIVSITGGGTIATVTNLDQTAKQWSGTVGSVVYEVRNGVREEDVICTPSVAAATQRFCVERLLTSTSMQVRNVPHTSLVGSNWQCQVPTWDKVKRVSYSTEAVPPDVKNNGTWVCHDGRERYDFQDFKIYMDLADLTVAQRTGRWWQLQMMPRGVNATSGDFYFSNFEFYSPSGARLGVSQNTFTNNSLQNSDFLSSHVSRLDFIQSRYDVMTVPAGFNGTVDLGGANGDTLTLTTGGNKFLGFQIDTHADGVTVAGAGGNITSATAVFTTSDVGRFLHITASVGSLDLGYYRIATRVSATAITVVPPSGTGTVTFTGTTGCVFTVHEGISGTGSAPDRIVFLDDLTREYTIATINDTLTTITIVEGRQTAVTGKQWEIRRPAFETASGAVDSTKLARLVEPATTYPLQTGDVACDSRGALRFWADDIGSGNQRTDGVLAGGNKVLTGTDFCSDDVGRLLYIVNSATAANNGIFRITAVNVGGTTATVDSAYPGGTIPNFTADAGPITYKVYGDRRFKITKQVTTLRA